MPDWAKPSGYFGLGLQSLFRMCESSEIKTKVRGEYGFIIETFKNTFNEIKTKIRHSNDFEFSGTEVSFFIEAPLVPETVPYSLVEYVESYDPITGTIIEVTPHLIQSIIKDNFSNCKVKLFYNELELFNKASEFIGHADTVDSKKYLYDTDFEVGMDFYLFVDLQSEFANKFKYKNVPFDCNMRIRGVSGVCDIFSKNAAHWLTIDRMKVNKTNNIYTVRFINDGKAIAIINPELVNEWANKKIYAGCARKVMPLFNDAYKGVSIDSNSMGSWVSYYSDFAGWFSKFIFMPKRGLTRDNDLNNIYEFHSKHTPLTLDRTEFLKMYNEVWDLLEGKDASGD